MNTKLKQYIKKLGMTIRSFSGICGISESRMYSYANGEDIPKNKAIKIKKWLEFLMSKKKNDLDIDVTLEDLLINNVIKVEVEK